VTLLLLLQETKLLGAPLVQLVQDEVEGILSCERLWRGLVNPFYHSVLKVYSIVVDILLHLAHSCGGNLF
jgi:hypothetical protein